MSAVFLFDDGPLDGGVETAVTLSKAWLLDEEASVPFELDRLLRRNAFRVSLLMEGVMMVVRGLEHRMMIRMRLFWVFTNRLENLRFSESSRTAALLSATSTSSTVRSQLEFS